MSTDCNCGTHYVCYDCRERANQLKALEQKRQILMAEEQNAILSRRSSFFSPVVVERTIVREVPSVRTVYTSGVDRVDAALIGAGGALLGHAISAFFSSSDEKKPSRKLKGKR